MSIPAAHVWAVLILGALAYDIHAVRQDAETLSEWCGNHQCATYIVGGYLLAHLAGHPRALQGVDPLHKVAQWL